MNEEAVVGTVMVTILAVELLVVGMSQPGAVFLWNFHPVNPSVDPCVHASVNASMNLSVTSAIPFSSEKQQTDLVTLTLIPILTLILTTLPLTWT